MSSKSKSQKKKASKPLKARDLRPAWLDKPKTMPAPKRRPRRSYSEMEDWEKRQTRAIGLAQWMGFFKELTEIKNALNRMISPEDFEDFTEEELDEKAREVWSQESTEELLRQGEEQVLAKLKAEDWRRSPLPSEYLDPELAKKGDWVLVSAPEIKLSQSPFEPSNFLILNTSDLETPLKKAIYALDLAGHHPGEVEKYKEHGNNFERMFRLLLGPR
jgi:hypothetical protein